MTDPVVVETTATILFQGYPRDCRQIAAVLADESRTFGDADRAEMWRNVGAALEVMGRPDLIH